MKLMIVGVILFIFGGLPAKSAEYRINGDYISISGNVKREDVVTFVSLVDQHKSVDSVIFEKCLGGEAGAALSLAKIIRDRKFSTIVKGQCSSACAVAFLGGVNRAMDVNSPLNMVFFHMARNSDNKIDENTIEANKYLIEKIDELTDGKIINPIRSLILNSNLEAQGVMFYSLNVNSKIERGAFYCDGSQGADVSRCQLLPDIDLYAFGILTK